MQASLHDAPIGVYDSGVGGISVLRALRAALPQESFVYVADSGHAPYGDRPQAFLRQRAHEVVGLLAGLPVKAVVLACNTVSVAAAASLRTQFALPIIAMEPAIKPAAARTRSGTVLVLATAYTVRSESVQRLCREYGGAARVILQPCPGLVEQVERGDLDAPRTGELLDDYLRPGIDAGADTVVLGCTHYAFLHQAIARRMGAGVAIIEPSEAIARQLQARLAGALAPPAPARTGRTRYYTSGRLEDLQAFLATVGEDAHSVQALPPAAPDEGRAVVRR